MTLSNEELLTLLDRVKKTLPKVEAERDTVDLLLSVAAVAKVRDVGDWSFDDDLGEPGLRIVAGYVAHIVELYREADQKAQEFLDWQERAYFSANGHIGHVGEYFDL